MGVARQPEFDVKWEADRVVSWAKGYMRTNGPKAPIIIGISGGKDSTITAAACVKAVGADRVIGVSIPDKGQTSDKAIKVCDALGIKRLAHYDLSKFTDSMYAEMGMQMADWGCEDPLSDVVKWNHPARLRMSVLYMYANQLGGRVANTCNMSETYVGYDTRWGDQCGDFSLFQEYTASEVKAIGRQLGVPDIWVDQVPSDDLCGMSDEDRWGFTYSVLDKYLRGSNDIPEETEKKIVKMHNKALYKIVSIALPCVHFTTTDSRSLYV